MSHPDQQIFTYPTRKYTLNALRKVTQQILGVHMPVGIDQVVELGCGDGFFYENIAPENLKPFYRGYDNHRPSLEVFRQQAPEAKLELAEADNLDLPDESADIVIGFSSFPLFNQPKVAAEIARITRPGGRVFMFQDNLITNPTGKNDQYDKLKQVEKYHQALEGKFTRGKWLYKAGVDIAEAVVISPHQEIKDKITDEFSDSDQAIIVATSRDIGRGEVHFGTLQSAQLDFQKVKSDLGNPKILDGLTPVPGQEVVEYVRIRYLVAEKKSW